VDMGTGMWMALAVMAALHRRASDGAGSHVTTSLLDTAVTWMAYHLQGYFGTGEVPGPMGSGLGMIAPYEAFPTADGHVMIAAGNDATFRRLCHALELAALAEDPRLATNPGRVAHREELVAAVATRTRRERAEGIVARLQAAAVPCAPIQDVGDVARDEQVAAAGMLRPVADAPLPGYVDVALPARWDGARAPVRRPPPRPGEHTDEILDELGLRPG
jgi:crotonobetainyl-CoA:carnitine CoA-transferase CaiB-like acyl-CoA transferase